MRLWVRNCISISVGDARKLWCSPLASLLPEEHSGLHSHVARVGVLLCECGCVHAKLVRCALRLRHSQGASAAVSRISRSRGMSSRGRPCRHACRSRRPPFAMPSLAPYLAAASAPASPHAPLSGTATPNYTAQPPPPGSHAAHAARSCASSPRATEQARAQAPPAAGAEARAPPNLGPPRRAARLLLQAAWGPAGGGRTPAARLQRAPRRRSQRASLRKACKGRGRTALARAPQPRRMRPLWGRAAPPPCRSARPSAPRQGTWRRGGMRARAARWRAPWMQR